MSEKRKLLIVDDDVQILSLYKKALKGDGVTIDEADNMTDAERLLKNNKYTVVLADLRLTGIIGREGLLLLEYVHERSPETRVILATGYGSPEIEREAYEKGAFHYFEKPVDLMELRNKIEQAGLYSGSVAKAGAK